jgi:hypothetical protein
VISFTPKAPPKARRPSKYTELVREAVRLCLEEDPDGGWLFVTGTTYNGLHNACDPSGAIFRTLLEEYGDRFRPEVTSREERTDLDFRVVPR